MYFNGHNTKYKTKFRRELLMAPADYYEIQFPGLKKNQGWAKVRCVFHHDENPSLSINLDHGHFKCHACGAKGGDIISFHARLYNMGFVDTAKTMGALI